MTARGKNEVGVIQNSQKPLRLRLPALLQQLLLGFRFGLEVLLHDELDDVVGGAGHVDGGGDGGEDGEDGGGDEEGAGAA